MRIALYAVLIAVGVHCAREFLAAYQARMIQAERRFETWDPEEREAAPADPTNALAESRGEEAATNAVHTAAATNGPLGELSPTNATAPVGEATGVGRTERAQAPMGWYAAGGLLAVLAFALLAAYDIAHFLEHRAHRLLTSEPTEGGKDEDYEEAERLWANGDHLGAVHGLREYSKKHPRRVHARFRIAEIYEKDLGNTLAAALEYEEILQFRLEAERWGWAAIHLCNLYYHLQQNDKAEALLRRIVHDYGHTQAARKARKRLGLPEDGSAAAPESEALAAPAAEPAPEEGGIKLPPGFRPRK